MENRTNPDKCRLDDSKCQFSLGSDFILNVTGFFFPFEIELLALPLRSHKSTLIRFSISPHFLCLLNSSAGTHHTVFYPTLKVIDYYLRGLKVHLIQGYFFRLNKSLQLFDRASKGYGSLPCLTSQTSLHACIQRFTAMQIRL